MWGGGWLDKDDALDFAGGTVIHINSGAAALVAAIILGKRKGWGRESFHPHNLPTAILGAGILWFGFNADSALSAGTTAVNAAGANGLFFGNPVQLWIQVKGALVTIVYSIVLTYAILKLIDATVGLRVTQEEEVQGLDLNQHSEIGYNM